MSDDVPVLAMPRALPAGAPIWRRIGALRGNFLSLWGPDSFDSDLIVERFGGHPIFVANAPDLAARVLLDNAANYIRSPIFTRVLEPGLGKGLLTTEGEVWRRQRRILAPAFAAKRAADFAPAMVRHAHRMSGRWEARGAGVTLDVTEAMSELALGVISEAMFSVVDDPQIALIGQAVAAYQRGIRPSLADLLGLPAWVPRPERRRVRKIAAESDRVIRRVIAARRTKGGPDDLLAAMLVAEGEGRVATEDEVRDQVMTIITAGHETTATVLMWVWYLLALHPIAEARLHAELDGILEGRLPAASDVPRLPYTRQIVDEAMRLYPPIHTVARQALGADRLRDVSIPAGATVLVMPWLLHRRPKFWSEPDRFDPDRFASPEASARPRFVYLPFGGGPRVCIGAAFATMEAVMLLATIAQRWRLRLAEGAKVEPVGSITLRPGGPLEMTIERRR